MKKKLLLGAFAVIGIMVEVTIVPKNDIHNDELLKANVEALAAQGPEDGANEVHCIPDGGICEYELILCDEFGNVLRDAEGKVVSITQRLHGLRSLPKQNQ